LGWGDYFQDPKLEALTPFGRARIRFVEKARSTAGRRSLDLCCGAGWLALEQARAGKHVDAVDISEEEQNVAREYQASLNEEIPGDINWIATDLNNFTTAPEQYDQITAWDGLHHIEKIERLCEQIESGLRPGGHFLLSERVWGGDSPSVRARIGKYLEQFLWTFAPTPKPYTYGRKFRELWATLGLFFKTKILRKKHTQRPWQIADEGFCSPFEDASGQEILRIVNKRFHVEKTESYGGFTEEVLRSLYLPRFLRIPTVLFLGWLDHLLVSAGLLEGKIAILYARKRVQE
jgi:SAM-dependent methyltransferase